VSAETAKIIDLGALRRTCAQCSLQQLCLPAAIGASDMERLDRIVKGRRPLARGDRLFEVGSPLSALYVAREGAFKTTTISEDGNAQIIGFHLPGELIGLDALAAERHRCEAEALEDANVCEVPYSQLQQVAAQVPGLQRQLMRVIGRGTEQDHSHLAMMGRKHAVERVALFLHSLSERYRLLNRPHEAFALPMSREDIANFLGLVIETVSRSFSKLAEDGVITVRGKQVRILSRAELDRIADHPA
jgi:CRP/FNR family transcriptional regulator, anaerobic regulatory protein